MKKTIVSVVALLGLFVCLVVNPVSASDAQSPAKAQEKLTQPAEDAVPQKVNINEADIDTLSHIKGIGRETAQNIITHRTEVGAFENIEDLKQIKGIGEKTFEQIRPHISVH